MKNVDIPPASSLLIELVELVKELHGIAQGRCPAELLATNVASSTYSVPKPTQGGQARATLTGDQRVALLQKWHLAAMMFKQLVNVTQNVQATVVLANCLKYARQFLEIFLKAGLLGSMFACICINP